MDARGRCPQQFGCSTSLCRAMRRVWVLYTTIMRLSKPVAFLASVLHAASFILEVWRELPSSIYDVAPNRLRESCRRSQIYERLVALASEPPQKASQPVHLLLESKQTPPDAERPVERPPHRCRETRRRRRADTKLKNAPRPQPAPQVLVRPRAPPVQGEEAERFAGRCGLRGHGRRDARVFRKTGAVEVASGARGVVLSVEVSRKK